MAIMSPSQPLSDQAPGDPDRTQPYQPGVCNIGPAEIARRRRVGHVGLAVSIVLLVALIVAGLPAWTRLLVAVPAVMAASGYLQAWLRFCAGFGSRGVFNFGELGRVEKIRDPSDKARDLARARQIGLASLVIGLIAGIAAALLPL